jgi:hypothetical protein
MPSTPAGRRLFEHISRTWERDSGDLEAIRKELFPLVIENIKKSRVKNASEIEANSLQQSGLEVDSSALNSAVSHPDNMSGTAFPERNAENGSETPGDSSVAPSGTEALHNSKPQPKPDHQYTSLLWEHGSKIRVAPCQENTQLSSYPVLWSCRVTFGEKSAEGRGGNIRIAKHEACRRLCGDLGLD